MSPRQEDGLVSLSVHDENAEVFGQLPNGRVDKAKVAAVDRVVEAVAALGFSDIMSSPKQGTVHIPSATSRDKHALRMALLRLERSLGGPGIDGAFIDLPSLRLWG